MLQFNLNQKQIKAFSFFGRLSNFFKFKFFCLILQIHQIERVIGQFIKLVNRQKNKKSCDTFVRATFTLLDLQNYQKNMKTIKFLRTFYVFERQLWSELTYLQINYPQNIRKTLRMSCQSSFDRSKFILLQDQHYYISLSATTEEMKEAPFRQSKYRTVKIYNQFYKLIIAVHASQEWNSLSLLITKLLYYTKFLKNSIKRQIELNIADILFDAFLSILRRKFISKDPKAQHSSNLAKFLDGLVLDSARIMQHQEIINIVYKSALYMGFFPIELMLKYSGYNWIQQKYHIFRYNNSTPWNSCLESAIKLGRDIYYDENTKARSNPNKYFIKIRLLDFFPLDSWIETMAEFLRLNLEMFVNEMKHLIFVNQQRLGNASELSTDGLLAKSNTEPTKEKFFKIFQKGGSNKIYTTISQEFYTYYQTQLFQSKIFKRISNVIADSYEPKLLFSDPNEMISSIVEVINDNLKKIAQPLVRNQKIRATFDSIINNLETHEGISNFWKAAKAVDNADFKLYTKFASQKDLVAYIPPPAATQLIDYFGFYSDSLSKVFFENLKEVQHQHFEVMWNQFKQINKAEPQLFEKRFEYAQNMYQWQQKGKLNINKKAIKSVNAHILMYMKEIDERQKEICKTLMFWYYNSIRLKNSRKYGKLLSCIGSVLIKDTHLS